jgi:hypothetical protein
MKALNGVKNWWKSLTPGQQLFVVLVIVIVIWIARNALKGFVEGAENAIQNVSEEQALNNAGIKATYTNSQYKSMADILYSAMDGYGTDDELVYKQFAKLKNDVDFVRLDDAFGVREATDNLFGLYEPLDLRGWVKDDLSESQIKTLNSKLKSQGITKRI